MHIIVPVLTSTGSDSPSHHRLTEVIRQLGYDPVLFHSGNIFDLHRSDPVRTLVTLVLCLQQERAADILQDWMLPIRHTYPEIIELVGSPERLPMLLRERKSEIALYGTLQATPLIIQSVRVIYRYLHHPELCGEVLERTLGVSRYRLSDELERSGLPPAGHTIMQVRVHEAKRLLRTTSMPVAELALGVGYPNVSSFNRMFHQLTGSTPSEMRRASGLLGKNAKSFEISELDFSRSDQILRELVKKKNRKVNRIANTGKQ